MLILGLDLPMSQFDFHLHKRSNGIVSYRYSLVFEVGPVLNSSKKVTGSTSARNILPTLPGSIGKVLACFHEFMICTIILKRTGGRSLENYELNTLTHTHRYMYYVPSLSLSHTHVLCYLSATLYPPLLSFVTHVK